MTDEEFIKREKKMLLGRINEAIKEENYELANEYKYSIDLLEINLGEYLIERDKKITEKLRNII